MANTRAQQNMPRERSIVHSNIRHLFSLTFVELPYGLIVWVYYIFYAAIQSMVISLFKPVSIPLASLPNELVTRMRNSHHLTRTRPGSH